jgi:hypothetical protein
MNRKNPNCAACQILIPESRGNKAKFCSPECLKKSRKRVSKTTIGSYKNYYKNSCLFCKEEFECRRPDKLYCGRPCKRLFYALKNPQIKKIKPTKNPKLRDSHGVSWKDRLSLYESQKGLCDVCSEPLGSIVGRGTHLDHDHSSGLVRALVHGRCNYLIGVVENNMGKMIESYLNRHKANPSNIIYRLGTKGKPKHFTAIIESYIN